MKRVDRGQSPVPFDRYDRIRQNLNNGEVAMIRRQDQPPNNLFINPIQQGHPFLRNLGLVGLGAGIGVLGYRYHRPAMKLGQKFINYATDKFHHLFQPNNSTATTQQQIGNREAF